eukprot:scaffold388_cov244-Pinguiococcus_pyrenoidosus.AAC.28
MGAQDSAPRERVLRVSSLEQRVHGASGELEAVQEDRVFYGAEVSNHVLEGFVDEIVRMQHIL